MKLTIEDILKHITGQTPVNCPCACCTLGKMSEDTDSKEEAHALRQFALNLDNIKSNVRNTACSLKDEHVDDVETLAVKLEEIGFPKCAELVRGWIKIVQTCRDLHETAYAETEEKEKEAVAAAVAANNQEE